MDKKIELKETIRATESIKIRKESVYLIISNKEKCQNLLNKKELEEGDIIEVLISLHIILEVGLNILFRTLALMSIKKDIDELEIIKNIDGISFIDKTILFIYNSKFNFNDRLGEATSYHRIIGTLRDFSKPRNQLLHGHAIVSICSDNISKDSSLKKIINLEFLEKQIEKFQLILNGMKFYLDCLDSSLTSAGKESYKKSYLDDEFINNSYLKNKK